MGKLYVIDGMGRGFDGLVVEAGDVCVKTDKQPEIVEIVKIINDNQVFGDRNVSFPVSPGCLFVRVRNLKEYDFARKQFSSKNPLGAYQGETRVRRNELEAVIVEYSEAMTVAILEHEEEEGKYGRNGRAVVHTRYNQNYFAGFSSVKLAIDEEVKKGELDDLIFRLKELKKKELSLSEDEE
jgi:hypothetical protein